MAWLALCSGNWLVSVDKFYQLSLFIFYPQAQKLHSNQPSLARLPYDYSIVKVAKEVFKACQI